MVYPQSPRRRRRQRGRGFFLPIVASLIASAVGSQLGKGRGRGGGGGGKKSRDLEEKSIKKKGIIKQLPQSSWIIIADYYVNEDTDFWDHF